MAEVTNIAWCDATFNPWKICTPVGPGCLNCYAAAMSRRFGWGEYKAGVPRQRTSVSNWRKPMTWQRYAEKGILPDGKTVCMDRRPRVFCASLADVFDMEVPDAWRHDLFELIHMTPGLDWLLLTKRIVRVKHYTHCLMPNVWIGATIVNQEEADRDVPRLVALPAAVRFVSYEPALGPVNWDKCGEGINWLIIGGESTQGAAARDFRVEWARQTVAACKAAGVPVFVKQMGSRVIDRNDAGFDGCDRRAWPLRPDGCDPDVEHEIHGYVENYQGADVRVKLVDRAGADPAEWPKELQVQEFPE